MQQSKLMRKPRKSLQPLPKSWAKCVWKALHISLGLFTKLTCWSIKDLIVALLSCWASTKWAHLAALIHSCAIACCISSLTMHPSCSTLRCWFRANLATKIWDAEPNLSASRALTRTLFILVFFLAISRLYRIDSDHMSILKAYHH